MKFKNIQKTEALILFFFVTVTGCNAGKKTQSRKIESSETILPSVVNIGTQQIPDDERIAIAEGYFEQSLGVKVNILEFQAGDIRNAMVAKDIDFALLGSSSAALGIAQGMDVEMIWIHEILGDAEQLVARDGSKIESVSDLKGKKVATPFSSTSHYSLLKALELYNVSEKDVTLYDMQMPDIYTAWQRGDIDAAYGWEPVLSVLLKNGKMIISSKDLAARGITTSDVEIVRTEFAKKYPILVSKYIRALNKAVELYQKKPSDAVRAVAKSLNITQEEAQKQMQGSIWLTAQQQLDVAYLGTDTQKGHMAESLYDMADFLFEQKTISSQPQIENFRQAVNSSYIEKALQEN
jgi:taurine transport system substrate-binding protein